MRYEVKDSFYDREAMDTRVPGEIIDVTKGRADEINAAFPGTLAKVEKPKKSTKE